MKKSILFTSLAAAVLSSALVSAEETPVESLASSTDSTVVTTETSSTASSETLSDIIATGTPAATTTESSESTVASSTEVTPASSEVSASSTPESTTASSEDGVVKLDFLKNYISRGEKSERAYDVVAVIPGGVLSGNVTSLTRNADGSYNATLSTGQVLTLSSDKVSPEIVSRLSGTASSTSKTEASSSTTESSTASTTASSATKTETSSTKTESTTTTVSSTEASTNSAVDFEALKSNDFSSIVGKSFYNKDGKVVTFSADGSLGRNKKLRYAQIRDGQLWFVPEAMLGQAHDNITILVPAGVEFSGTDSSRTRLILSSGSVGPEGVGAYTYYLDAPVTDGEMTTQVSSTLASLTDHECFPSEVVTVAGHQPSATRVEESKSSSKTSVNNKETTAKLPATGEQSGLVAGLLGAGLLAMTAILRKRKAN